MAENCWSEARAKPVRRDAELIQEPNLSEAIGVAFDLVVGGFVVMRGEMLMEEDGRMVSVMIGFHVNMEWRKK